MVLKLYNGTKFRENGQKSQKSQNLIPTKFNTFKVTSCSYKFACKKTIMTLPFTEWILIKS